MNIKITCRQVKEIALFLTTGVVAYLIYTALFILLRIYLPDLAAISLAYCLAWIVHFLLSTWIVFRSRVQRIGSGLLLRSAVLYLLSYVLSVTSALTALRLGVTPVFATAIGVASTTVFNYLMSRYWVFR